MATAICLCNIIKINYTHRNEINFMETLNNLCSSFLLLIRDDNVDIRNYISKYLITTSDLLESKIKIGKFILFFFWL